MLNNKHQFWVKDATMQIFIDETQLKALFKAALVEVMEERRDLIRDAVEEALEDIALSRAIQEGETSTPVSRAEVFKLLPIKLSRVDTL